jgi:hypothetical protein
VAGTLAPVRDEETAQQDDAESFQIFATLKKLEIVDGQTNVNYRLKIECAEDDWEALREAKKAGAHDLIFNKVRGGRGATVKGMATKDDADGNTSVVATIILPQSAIVDSSQLNLMVSKHALLVLTPEQMGFDLTKRAE